MPIELKSYRSRLMDKLIDPSEAKHYINAALKDSNEMFLEAVKDVAQAHQMSKVAKDSGMARESLYRSLSRKGNPTFDTLIGVLKVLGLEFDRVRQVKETDSVPLVSTSRNQTSRGSRRRFERRKVHTSTTGTQIAFNFESAKSSGIPDLRISSNGIFVVSTARYTVNEPPPLPAPHVCNALLERDYGQGNYAVNSGIR